jgi:hypothetical protein
VTDDTLTVDLSDGRTISEPLTWYPAPRAWHTRRACDMATHRSRRGDSLAGTRRGHFGRRFDCRKTIG